MIPSPLGPNDKPYCHTPDGWQFRLESNRVITLAELEYLLNLGAAAHLPNIPLEVRVKAVKIVSQIKEAIESRQITTINED